MERRASSVHSHVILIQSEQAERSSGAVEGPLPFHERAVPVHFCRNIHS